MILYSDPVADFLDRCDRAGIKNPASFLISKRVVVYDWLKGAFPYGILPTDIDGFVHLNGQFLMMDFKRDGVIHEGKIPKGQLRCYVAISKCSVTVLLIGTDGNEEPSCVQRIFNGKVCPVEATNRAGIRRLCEAWSTWAEKQNAA